MKIISQLFCCLLFILSASTAFAEDWSTCEDLVIQISNASGQNCTLKANELIHGVFVSGNVVPAAIRNGDSKMFVLKQTWYGPDIRATYQCGTGTITIRSQQNYCYMKAGKIHGTIEQSDGITAHYGAKNGSYWWGSHGTINWSIDTAR